MNDDDLRPLHGSRTPCRVFAPLLPGAPSRRITGPVIGLQPDSPAAAALAPFTRRPATLVAGRSQPLAGGHH
ncbi:MAG TPA: hypothetical protein VIW27_07055 [Gammaproteobacteria bacterium]|jgi:hypothetical protein